MINSRTMLLLVIMLIIQNRLFVQYLQNTNRRLCFEGCEN